MAAAAAADEGESEATAKWRATLREARAVVLAITVLVAIGGTFCVGTAFSLFLGPAYASVFLGGLCAAVAFSFATQAGISRAVMLLVPRGTRPFALPPRTRETWTT